MTLNCCTGCIGNVDKSGVRKPLNNPNLMPWVEVSFASGGNMIAVSNISSRGGSLGGKNYAGNAVVKSFSYGVSTGFGVELEIVDELGGQFSQFFNRLSIGNNYTAVNAATTIGTIGIGNQFSGIGAIANTLAAQNLNISTTFRFGWATSNCDGTFSSNTNPRAANACSINNNMGRQSNCTSNTTSNSNMSLMSCLHTMFIKKIKVDVSHGMFVYKIEASDLTPEAMATRDYHVYGNNANPTGVTQAIRNAFQRINIATNFIKVLPSGQTAPLTFALTGATAPSIIAQTNEPQGTFRPLGINLMQAAAQWLSEYVTDRQRGIIHFWDNSVSGPPVLTFAETDRIMCDPGRNVSNFNLGTYVVGSNCSPVISFVPDIEFIPVNRFLRTYSIQASPLSGRIRAQQGTPCLQNQPGSNHMGNQVPMVVTENAVNAHGPDAPQFFHQNTLTNYYANLMYHPIKAQLQIQGDPFYDRPLFCQLYFLSIVVLQPFHLSLGCSWSGGDCNEIMTSCKWMITKISHQISVGTFTTTIEMLLPVPGVDYLQGPTALSTSVQQLRCGGAAAAPAGARPVPPVSPAASPAARRLV